MCLWSNLRDLRGEVPGIICKMTALAGGVLDRVMGYKWSQSLGPKSDPFPLVIRTNCKPGRVMACPAGHQIMIRIVARDSH